MLGNTLIFYIIGDNGASTEGTLNGTFNELLTLNGALGVETAEFMASRIDDFGTPEAFNHCAVGWAHAMDTRTSGRSKWLRIGAAPATEQSCTGPQV